MDVNGGRLERYSGPSGGLYRHTELARDGEVLASTTLSDLTLTVDDVLGPK